MKKQFLDFIYGERFFILSEISRLTEAAEAPVPQCCDNMASDNEALAKLKVRKLQLSSINDIIEQYINIHHN